jgi:Fic family protein
VEPSASGRRYTLLEEHWVPEPTRSGPRRARVPVTVTAYLPAPLSTLELRVGEATLTAISDAERMIANAQAHADRVGVSTIALQLMRSEAIASSQIEGIPTPSSRALAKVLAKTRGDDFDPTGPAAATVANLHAVRGAYARAAAAAGPMTVADIQATHSALARADRWLAARSGELRQSQNWIGRDPHTPVGADFVPPPHRFLPDLLEDLCVYCSRRDVSPLLQAAVAHAQFETLHPFPDGNGRVGRTIIGEILCRGALARDVLPPVSLVLSGQRAAYVEALTAWRYDDDGPDRWISLLADAAYQAAQASIRLADEVAALQQQWRDSGPRRRRDSAAAKIIDLLPAHPVLTAAHAAEIAAVSEQAARAALNQLERDGVLAQITLGRRNRAWESVGLFALVDEIERTVSGGAVDAAGTR